MPPASTRMAPAPGQTGVIGPPPPALEPAPVTPQQLVREYVTGGQTGWIGQFARALSWAIDDITAEFGDDLFDRMLRDSQVAACHQVLKASIVEDGLTLAPAIEDKADPDYDRAVAIRDEADAMLEGLETPLDDVLLNLLDAISHGNKIAEQVYAYQPPETNNPALPGGKLLRLTALKVKPRRSTAFVVDGYLNVVGILAQELNQPSPVLGNWYVDPKNPPSNFVPPTKFLIHTFRPQDNDPRGCALDPETPVPTPDGWRKMDDLQPGDKVFDEEGRIRYVVARADWDDRPCYELTFNGGDKIIADENHQWQTHRSWERYQKLPPKVRTTKEIVATLHNDHVSGVRTPTVLGRSNHSIAWAKALDYPEQLLPVHPYFLGLWLGDGTGASSDISCHAQDLDETLALIGAAGFTARSTVNGGATNGRLIRVGGAKQWDSSGPAHALRLLGVRRDGGNVERKHIPEAYLRGSIQQRRDLLAGLMDADGTVNNEGRCEFSNSNLNLAEGVLELARSLGVPASLRLHHAARVSSDGHSRKDNWGVYFTPPWAPFKLERKIAKTITERVQKRHLIVGAQPVANRRTVCIETDGPSHLYLAGKSMVPTHNSLLRAAYVPWWLKQQILPEYRRYLAQFAGPSIWATTAEKATASFALDGTVTTPEQTLSTALLAFQNGTAAAFPFGTELHPLTMDGEGRSFLSGLAWCDAQITKAILTQSLATEEGAHQARAAAQVHQDVLDTLVRQAKRGLVRSVARQVLRPWMVWNFGEAALHLTPKPSLGTTEQQDIPSMWNAAAALARANYLQSSQLPAVDVKLGLPVRDLTQADAPAETPAPAAGDPEPIDAPKSPSTPTRSVPVREHTRTVRDRTAATFADTLTPLGADEPLPAVPAAADLSAEHGPARRLWDRLVPGLAGLLLAQSMGDGRWRWDAAKHRYRDQRTGKLLSPSRLTEARDTLADSAASARLLADQLANQETTVQAWELSMRAAVGATYVAQYAAGRGGVDQLTAADTQTLGGLMAAQFAYLHEFAGVIASGALSPAAIAARSAQYVSSSVQAFEKGQASAYAVDLPAYPGDSSSICKSNDRCAWRLEPRSDGSVAAFWDTEHDKRVCETCSARGDAWNPLIVWPAAQSAEMSLNRLLVELAAGGEGAWRTISGAHVFIENGTVTRGPADLVGRSTADLAPHEKPQPYDEKHPRAPKQTVTLTKSSERAFTGTPEPTKTVLSKQESGALGESVVLAYLKQFEGQSDARPANEERNNFPVDILHDHSVVEAKTGLVSNRPDSQKWRLTIGQPGKKETAWLKGATVEEVAEHNADKQRDIVNRKERIREEIERELGHSVSIRTITVILHPDKRLADVHVFSGLHQSIRWRSDQTQQGYKGTFSYASA